jgi:hypothetical protein
MVVSQTVYGLFGLGLSELTVKLLSLRLSGTAEGIPSRLGRTMAKLTLN